jgi:hypothetical protein
MSGCTTNLPRVVGSLKRRTPEQLAEEAIAAIGDNRRHGKQGETLHYAVCLDPEGRVLLDRVHAASPDELVMSCSYKSNPDDLADALKHEIGARA